MINLLPPSDKENLLSEKNKKLIMVLGNVILISLICLILVLLSVQFYILGETNYHKSVLDDIESKYQTKDFLFFKSTIEEYNKDLALINAFYKKEVKYAETLKIISQLPKPEGLYLTNMLIEREINAGTKPDGIAVSLFGISNNRDSLLIFKKNIEDNKKLKNIYFPPDNWIKASNLNFYVTFKIYEE